MRMLVLLPDCCLIPSGLCLGVDAKSLSKVPGVKAFVNRVSEFLNRNN